MNNHIFWIASYPKSGNTLLRAIISSLFFSDDGVFDFSLLASIGQFDTIDRIIKNKKIFGDDLKNINDLKVLSKYFLKLQDKKLINFSEDFIFLKTHSSNLFIENNPFTIKENCRGIIYIIRDPRDVCVSLSRHFNISIEDSISFIKNTHASIHWKAKKNQNFKDDEKPSSLVSRWDMHVKSWTKKNWGVPNLVIKYEDLVYNKINEIEKIIFFFEKYYNFQFKNKKNKITNIVSSTDFNELKNKEKTFGFSESSRYSNFFAVGKKNQWSEKLTKDQILTLESHFDIIMNEYGYI